MSITFTVNVTIPTDITDDPQIRAEVSYPDSVLTGDVSDNRGRPIAPDLTLTEVPGPPSLPNCAAFDFDSAGRYRSIAFGFGKDSVPAAFRLGQSRGMMIIGATGSGKSELARALVYGAVAKGASVQVVDLLRRGSDFGFVKRYAKPFVTDLPSAQRFLQALETEVTDRVKAMSEAGVSLFIDLPDSPMMQLIVVIDELSTLIGSESVSISATAEAKAETEKSNATRAAVAASIGRIVRMSAGTGVCLILVSQRVPAGPGNPLLGAARPNLDVVLMGRSGPAERAAVFRDPQAAPDLGEVIPVGRGVWEPAPALDTGLSPMAVQVWHATQEELAAALRKRLGVQ